MSSNGIEGHRRGISKAEMACSSRQHEVVVRALVCAKPQLRRHGARDSESKTDMAANSRSEAKCPPSVFQNWLCYVESFGKKDVGSKEADDRLTPWSV